MGVGWGRDGFNSRWVKLRGVLGDASGSAIQGAVFKGPVALSGEQGWRSAREPGAGNLELGGGGAGAGSTNT